MPTSARLASVKRIQDLYIKLSKEALVSEELDELVTLTTDLHESAVVLRYKAAEERVFEAEKPVAKREEVASNDEVVSDVESPIDFSIFEETKEAPSETLDFENKIDIVEKEIPEEKTETTRSNTDWASYFDKVLNEHSSGLQTPINALSGSFGLNERILYINELFNKESEVFSSAIQKLDGLSDWDTCTDELIKMANTRNWDTENDATGEFIIHVKRRYD